jgi:heparan-alpha-glucosaminide N-acetyltransferase
MCDVTTPDPEGLLGCLTSCVMTYLGVCAGRVVLHYDDAASRIKRWLCWAIVLGCTALGLTGATQNDGVIPLNKNMWSVSFVLALAALALVALTICYVLVDVLKVWNGTHTHSLLLCCWLHPLSWFVEGLRGLIVA